MEVTSTSLGLGRVRTGVRAERCIYTSPSDMRQQQLFICKCIDSAVICLLP